MPPAMVSSCASAAPDPCKVKFPLTLIFPFIVSVFPPAPVRLRLRNVVLPALSVPVIVTVLPVGLRVTVLVAPAVKVPLLVNDAPLKVIVLPVPALKVPLLVRVPAILTEESNFTFAPVSIVR